MKIINPSYEILSYPKDALIQIERAARTCYKSEDRITEGSAESLVRHLLKLGHWPMIEFGGDIVVRFVSNRGFTHELVRHRLASLAQECVTGDTKISKDKTIKELFYRSGTPYGKTHNKTLRLRSCNSELHLVPNKIVKVMYNGKGMVYRVRTSWGYEIKATENHEFMVQDGCFVKLRDLRVGDQVMVNGRPSLLQIDEADLREAYLVRGMSPQEIANENNIAYRSVLRRLKMLGIFKRRLNDKDPEKYNIGRTPESTEKMRQTILNQYEGGRIPWNKGLTESDSLSVMRQGNALREQHHNNGSAEGNSNWRGGVSKQYYMGIVPAGHCSLCGAPDAHEIHHLDEDRRNNSKENLIRICINCHDKLHHGWHVGKKAHLDVIESITGVGVEDVYDIEMESPYHNYVANGFVVHNSTRYCNYSKGKFDEEITCISPYVTSGNQADIVLKAWMNAEHSYMELIKAGVPSEIAREVLPIGLKAEINIKANLVEWHHIFVLRCSKKAHPRMRQLMIALLEELKN